MGESLVSTIFNFNRCLPNAPIVMPDVLRMPDAHLPLPGGSTTIQPTPSELMSRTGGCLMTDDRREYHNAAYTRGMYPDRRLCLHSVRGLNRCIPPSVMLDVLRRPDTHLPLPGRSTTMLPTPSALMSRREGCLMTRRKYQNAANT